MKYCAFLSMQNLDGYECYDHLLYKPLADLGWKVDEVPWRRTSVNWNKFDAVIVRSPWNYQHYPKHFIKVLEQIDASSAHLENSLNIIRWNLDKTYLKELYTKGISTFPTLWRKSLQTEDIQACFSLYKVDQLIIKPLIGASAEDTYLINAKMQSKMEAKAARTFNHRPCMIQPFMTTILSEGEFSLFYFGPHYSHAILKTPKQGDFRSQEEHGGRLTSVSPGEKLRSAAKKVMHALPETPLYTRVDFVRSKTDKFYLMELELIEPSLYFNMDSESPRRFATQFDRRMQEVKA